MTAGHDGEGGKQAVEKKAKVEQQRARQVDGARRGGVQDELRYRRESRGAGVAAVDALQQTGVGSSEMSGFVRDQPQPSALSFCERLYVKEAFPAFRLSPPCSTAALCSAKRSATTTAAQSQPARAYRRQLGSRNSLKNHSPSSRPSGPPHTMANIPAM